MGTKPIEQFAKDNIVTGVVIMCFLCLVTVLSDLDYKTIVHDSLVLLGLREDVEAEAKAAKILKSGLGREPRGDRRGREGGGAGGQVHRRLLPQVLYGEAGAQRRGAAEARGG
mmetsp:Transcript_1641/g.6026  ORF Transcript_1641/g.6026 Transcript_1641/m.6026 type:complete len:113 (-) Transcript_1641:1188-1526(-)